MKKILSIFLLCLTSATVFSEGMSSRSVGNSSKYPSNVVQTADGYAQVIGFTNAAQRTTATTLGYTDNQAGATAYKAAVADTGNAANCQAAYSKTCGQLTKTEYAAVLTMQSQTLSVSASASSIYIGRTATLTTTGNQSTVTYTASGACTVSGSTVTASNSPGSCTITANAPIALPTYKAASPTNIAITVNPLIVQQITLSADDATVIKNSTTKVRSAGYQAGYYPTYTASSNCSVTDTKSPAWTVTAGNTVGTCTITGNAPANGDYAAWTGTINITIGNQGLANCFVIDFTNNNYNPTCGAGNRLATFTEMQTPLCQAVAFTWRGSSSVYLQGSDGRYIRNGVGYGTNWTIATFAAGATTDAYGKSGNSFSLGSTEAAVCGTP